MLAPTKQEFVILTPLIKNNAMRALGEIDPGRDRPMVIKIEELKRDKSLRQLGALFGLWTKEAAQAEGKSEDEIHSEWKAKFLARIYCINPVGDAQEQWVELLAEYQEQGKLDKLMRHAARISLKWSTLEQTKAYMAAIEEHYMSIGRPLTIPDRFWKAYRSAR